MKLRIDNQVIKKFRFLYQYGPYNEDFRKKIENSELWFSDPFNFNDPFDCQFRIIVKGNKRAYNIYAKKSTERISSKIRSLTDYNQKKVEV